MDMMNAEKRDFTMKAKRLRRNGLVPGSVYGGPLSESISLQMKEPETRKLLANNNIGSRLQLKLDGKLIPVQLKEADVNNLSNEIMNVSFQALKADQKVNSVITVVLTNTDKVTATLEQMIYEIPYSALPADMIDTVEIDVDGMPVGTSMTIGDIKELQSDKLELHMGAEEMVFKIFEKKVAEEEEETTEDAE